MPPKCTTKPKTKARKKSVDRFQVVAKRDGTGFFRIIAANGEPFAHGEIRQSSLDLMRNVQAFRRRAKEGRNIIEVVDA